MTKYFKTPAVQYDDAKTLHLSETYVQSCDGFLTGEKGSLNSEFKPFTLYL